MISVCTFSGLHLKIFEPLYNYGNYKDKLLEAKGNDRIEMLTIFNGHVPLAIVGVMRLAPGVGEIWAFMDKSMLKHRMKFHRAIKELLGKCKEVGYHRLHATVVSDWVAGDKWIKRLGFKAVGMLEHYEKNGRNHTLYGRVL